MTSHEPITQQSAAPDNLATEVIEVPAPSPVFVDSTGRRRKVLQRVAYAFGGVCVLYGGLICVSLAGGPVSSSAILPSLIEHEAKSDPGPMPTPAAKVSPPVRSRVIEAAPRRAAPAGREESRFVGPRTRAVIPTPTRSPTARATPKPTLEDTRTASATPTPSPSPTAKPTENPSSAPVKGPPAGPAPASGGGGGGSVVSGSGPTTASGAIRTSGPTGASGGTHTTNGTGATTASGPTKSTLVSANSSDDGDAGEIVEAKAFTSPSAEAPDPAESSSQGPA